MLIDKVTIVVRAGNGGNGGSTLMRNGQTAKGGPDGGHGGNGGSIYVQGSSNITDLYEFRYKKKVLAENGVGGAKSKKSGKNGSDVSLLLPLGTVITDLDSGEVHEINEVGNILLLAKGGRGGRGNVAFKTSTNQTPRHGEAGEPGQVRNLLLNLRLIAEIGLVGLPNAGKSSLLRVLTNATPTIGAYPFTTLEPNIGMLGTHPIADIPGLIEGASTGKGLGIRFLKHIEKTKMLVHCIDSSEPDPIKVYEIVRGEFANYSPELAEKPEIILLTKTDLTDAATVKKCIAIFKKRKHEVLTCSIYDAPSIEKLKKALSKKL